MSFQWYKIPNDKKKSIAYSSFNWHVPKNPMKQNKIPNHSMQHYWGTIPDTTIGLCRSSNITTHTLPHIHSTTELVWWHVAISEHDTKEMSCHWCLCRICDGGWDTAQRLNEMAMSTKVAVTATVMECVRMEVEMGVWMEEQGATTRGRGASHPEMRLGEAWAQALRCTHSLYPACKWGWNVKGFRRQPTSNDAKKTRLAAAAVNSLAISQTVHSTGWHNFPQSPPDKQDPLPCYYGGTKGLATHHWLLTALNTFSPLLSFSLSLFLSLGREGW